MPYVQGIYPILFKENLSKNVFDFTIKSKEIASLAQPGQFVQIRVPYMPLRRPISLADINLDKDYIRIVFEIKGQGTGYLAQFKAWDNLDILGPLGRGFTMLPPNKRVYLIGGGIGTPPLVPLAGYYGGNATVITGFRNAKAVILDDEFKKFFNEHILCTDDGSMGIKGFVTDVLYQRLKGGDRPDMIYACGPKPMLQRVAQLAAEFDIECEISMEERMACGIGACLGCACKTHEHDGTSSYAHVCKDGPVFNSKEVIF
ncbi:dihydroorotate dehydrogenase electron transfer subunit [Fumia xinanensis]|uniref:Dihydroorotate dehydrogenase B (NAD(+)), electron transfer subunit n=1 Tax=Fumia xinanensis TaxID=2763659 RepID=A0A926E4I0_9FIRM|nr:dihydroorotate dehydrogenase electron transfer subunit [Fumia xinanensis]PWL43236.1 MAG: dihydroorotate dehydrogenase electron transfer subunit [Clostridiales bacterium]